MSHFQPKENIEVVVESNDQIGKNSNDKSSPSPEFFEEVGQIRALTTLIRRNVKSMEEVYNKQAWTSLSQNENSVELQQLMESTLSAASNVRNKLKRMKESNDRLPSEDPQKNTQVHMHYVLSQKFMTEIQHYSQLQNSYKDKYRERVQKQAEIVKPDVTKQEVEDLLESGGSSGFLTDQILNEQKHTEAKNVLLQMQEQQRDIKQLEKNIQELNQLFVDMQTIIEVSGEVLPQLEANLSSSVVNTSKAVQDLNLAYANRLTKRKKILFAVGALAIFLLIVIGVIAALIAGKVWA